MTTSVRGGQLARLLGQWHSLPGRHRSPDYAALAGAIRGLLSDGRLPLGVRLPAERELAESLGVSRTTVTAAYRALRETGHLTSRRGAGSWTTLPAGHRVATSGLWAAGDDREMMDLGVAASGAPVELVPAARAAADDLPRYPGSAGYHPAGLSELRDAVAAGYTARGVATSPEQILITAGTQQALDLVVRLSVPAGSPVLVEAPSYPNALAALSARRARINTHGIDPAFGWDGEMLLGALRQTRPRLAYVIPEFHNPTGHLMDAGLRERLVAAAHTAGTELVVDESFVDLSLDSVAMPPPVAVFDRHSRVVSIGGMSKAYWGGLRIGWVRASAPMVQRLAAIRVGVDMASPVLEQLVAVRLLRQGGPDRAAPPGAPGPRPGHPGGGAGAAAADGAGPPGAAAPAPGHAGRGVARAAAGVELLDPARWRHALGRTGRPRLQRTRPGGRGRRRTAGARPPVRARRHVGAV